MVAITTRAGKGAPLTNDELDANFVNLNTGLGAGVVGPAAVTPDALARFDGATGKLIKNSAWTLLDTGHLLPGNAASQDVGSPALRVATIWAAAGNFSNSITAPYLALTRYGPFASIYGRSSGDGSTEAVPTPSVGGQPVLVIHGLGRGVSDWGSTSGGGMVISASETWTDTAQGTNVFIQTTPNGTNQAGARWFFTDAGHFIPSFDNTYIIGDAAKRVRAGYFATELVVNNTPWWVGGVSHALDGQVRIAGSDGHWAVVDLVSFGGVPTIMGRAANGNPAAPQAAGVSHPLLNLEARGFDGSVYTNGKAQIMMATTQPWTSTATGTNILFTTTANNTTNPTGRWQLAHDGTWAPLADNAYDIGINGVSRVRAAYLYNLNVRGGLTVEGPNGILSITSRSGTGAPFAFYNNGGAYLGLFNGTEDIVTIDPAGNIAADGSFTTAGGMSAGYLGLSGPSAALGIGPRDGSGTTFQWYNPSGDYFAIHTGTIEAFKVDTAGNVTSPANIRGLSGGFGPEALPAMGGQAGVNRVLYWSTTPTLSAFVYDVPSGNLNLSMNGLNVAAFAPSGSTELKRLSVVNGPGIGYIGLNPGGPTNSGYVEFYDAAAARVGYIGFADSTNHFINITAEGGYSYKFNDPVRFMGAITFGANADLVEPRGRYWNRPAPGGHYTLTPSADQGALVVMVNPAPANVTIPPQSSGAWGTNARIDFTQWSTGTVTFVPGAGVNITSAGGKRKMNGMGTGCSLIQINPDDWWLVGDIVA